MSCKFEFYSEAIKELFQARKEAERLCLNKYNAKATSVIEEYLLTLKEVKGFVDEKGLSSYYWEFEDRICPYGELNVIIYNQYKHEADSIRQRIMDWVDEQCLYLSVSFYLSENHDFIVRIIDDPNYVNSNSCRKILDKKNLNI